MADRAVEQQKGDSAAYRGWQLSALAQPGQQSTDARCAVYFAIPGPFELEACRPDGLAETLP
jgi:hypothetical protein